MPPDKPRTRHGYTSDETELVKSALLSLAVTLGAYMNDLCVVGGLTPLLLIDLPQRPNAEPEHPGTIDLDVADRLVRHAARHAEVVDEALTILRRDFETIDMIGSARVAEFEGATDEAAEELAADAAGTVEDLLNACVARGLEAPRYAPPASREQSTA